MPRQYGDFHTYQIEDVGEDMVLERGYKDGERVPWNVFYTLNDLGLLYFKESDDDPQNTAPDPGNVDYEVVSDLSVEQRCEFISHVLSHYKLANVNSDAFIELLLSIADASLNMICPIVGSIVTNIPYEAETVIDVATTKDRSPIILACPLHYWYNRFYNGKSVLSYLDAYNYELIHYDGKYGYCILFGTDDESSTVPTVTLPDQFHEVFQKSQSDADKNNTLERMTFALEARCLNDSLGRTGDVIARGVDTLDNATLTILPIPADTVESVCETSIFL